MKKDATSFLYKSAVILCFAAMILVNTLANLLPLNGVTTGAAADSYANLFAPAGYTFAVWGLIYLLLALYVLGFAGAFRGLSPQSEGLAQPRTPVLFSLSCLCNIAWIFAWHYRQIALSLVCMLLLLVCLAALLLPLRRARLTPFGALLFRLPFEVYFGWILVATVANVTVLLVSMQWNGLFLPDTVWTAAALLAGAAVGTLVTLRFASAACGLVLLWAYAGILYRHLSPAGFGGRYPAVIVTVCLCLMLFAAQVLYVLRSAQLRRMHDEPPAGAPL